MKPSLPTRELEDRLCLALYRASHAMTAAYRTILAPLDLTYPQYIVMSALWADSPVTIKALGDVLESDYSTMSPLIKRLEAKDLVRRTRSDADEREVMVDLTETGRKLRRRAARVQPDVIRAAGLSTADRERLTQELHHLTRRLQQLGDQQS